MDAGRCDKNRVRDRARERHDLLRQFRTLQLILSSAVFFSSRFILLLRPNLRVVIRK
jgi:hypothetical protein